MSNGSKHDSIKVESLVERACTIKINTNTKVKEKQICGAQLVYVRLSVFNNYRDTIIIMISKLLSIVIVIVLLSLYSGPKILEFLVNINIDNIC